METPGSSNGCYRRLQWFELYSTTFRDDIEEDNNELAYLSREDLQQTKMDADLRIQFPHPAGGSTSLMSPCDSQNSYDVHCGDNLDGIVGDDCETSDDDVLRELRMACPCIGSSLSSEAESVTSDEDDSDDHEMDYDDVFSYDLLSISPNYWTAATIQHAKPQILQNYSFDKNCLHHRNS